MKKTVLILLVVLLSLNFVFAALTIPKIPCVFVGDVEYSGDSSLNLQGYDINVSVEGGEQWNVGKVGVGNSYDAMVNHSLVDNGDEITFWVGGVKTTEVGIWDTRETKELDLTITSYPVQIITVEENGDDGSSDDGDSGDSGDDSSSGSSSGGSGSTGGSSGGTVGDTISINVDDSVGSSGNVVMTGSAAEEIDGVYSQSEKVIAGLIVTILLLAGLIYFMSKKK